MIFKLKKSTFLFACTVLSVMLILMSGCGGDYLPGKYLYKANRKAQALDPKAASTDEIQDVIGAYRIVTQKWPLSMKSVEAHTAISNLYLLQKDLEAARDELQTVILNFSNKPEVAAKAQFAIGKIYEFEKDLETAEKEYIELYSRFPTTREGLMSPLYVAEMYKRQQMTEESAAAYHKALTHYREKLAEFGEIRFSAVLQNYIALTYASQGSWNEAVSHWQHLIETYADSQLVGPTYLTLGEIFYEKIKERTKAIEYLRLAAEKYPDTEIALRAQSKLVQIYFSSGEYDEVIELANTIANASDNDEIKAQSEMIIARSIDKKGDWPSAEEKYTTIMERYTDTVSALKVPLLLAQHYQGKDAEADLDTIYESALANYQKLMDSDTISERTKQSAFDLSNLIYAKQQNWDKIISEMDAIYQNKQESINKRSRALFIMAFLYQTKLNDPVESAHLYNTFLSEFESHPLRAVVEKQLEKVSE